MTNTKKFERDKVYNIRNGEPITIIYTNSPAKLNGTPAPLVGIDSNGLCYIFFADGRYAGDYPDFDLILPKPEPIVEWGRLAPDNKFHRAASEAIAREDRLWPLPGESSWPVAKCTIEVIED